MDNDRRTSLAATITPLRLIFWGSLICLIDFSSSQTINGSRFNFDLFDDFIGMALITAGVFRFARFTPSDSYAKGMAFVKVVAVVATFKALIDHVAFRAPDVWDVAWTFFSLVELGALVTFCSNMHLLCRAFELDGPARSWKTTCTLFVCIYSIPIGLFYSASLVAMLLGRSFKFNLGPLGLLLIPLFAVPLFHFFASTSRMARGAGCR